MQRIDSGLCPVGKVQLGEDIRDMHFHCPLTDHQRGRGREAFDLANRRNAIHFWHQEIEQYNLWYEISRQSDGLLAVAGLAHNRDIRLPFQHKAQSLPDHRVVINDQDTNHRSSSFRGM